MSYDAVEEQFNTCHRWWFALQQQVNEYGINQLDEPDGVELNPVMNEEINTMNSVVQIESSLDMQNNEIENRKRLGRILQQWIIPLLTSSCYRGKGTER